MKVIDLQLHPDIFQIWHAAMQCNSWGAENPLTLLTGNFLLTYREKGGKENWKIQKKRRKIKKKRESGKLKMERGKVSKWGEDFFVSFFFFFFFFFFLLFTFQNHWNLFWIYQNGNFLLGKAFHAGKKNQEKWLCPLWKIFLLYAPDGMRLFFIN